MPSLPGGYTPRESATKPKEVKFVTPGAKTPPPSQKPTDAKNKPVDPPKEPVDPPKEPTEPHKPAEVYGRYAAFMSDSEESDSIPPPPLLQIFLSKLIKMPVYLRLEMTSSTRKPLRIPRPLGQLCDTFCLTSFMRIFIRAPLQVPLSMVDTWILDSLLCWILVSYSPTGQLKEST